MITTKLIFLDDCFCGEMTDVNVWDKTLNSTEFTSALTSCCPATHGNIVSWRDMSMAELIGTSIQIPSLCDGKSLTDASTTLIKGDFNHESWPFLLCRNHSIDTLSSMSTATVLYFLW